MVSLSLTNSLTISPSSFSTIKTYGYYKYFNKIDYTHMLKTLIFYNHLKYYLINILPPV